MDIIIPVSTGHIEQLKMSLPFIKENLLHDRIIVITNKKNFSHICDSYVTCMDENKLLDFTYRDVEKLILSRGGKKERTGWYFQQFLKMGYANICTDPYYLVWDADTIPLKEIEFINNGKMLFNMKDEYHKPYFDTIGKLFSGKLKRFTRNNNSSFISEGMIIDDNIMREMINTIENNKKILGKAFWEKIINVISIEELSQSGFSEFETYGSYLLTYHGEKFQERPLNTERCGYTLFGECVSIDELKESGLDTVSFEEWDRKLNFKKMRRLCKKIRQFINNFK